MGEGQTKWQIVGSLDMSGSLHQTKEIYRKCAAFMDLIFLSGGFDDINNPCYVFRLC